MRPGIKTLRFIILCLFIHMALAGDVHNGPKAPRPKHVTGEEGGFSSRFTAPYPSTYSLGPGDSICFTLYDYGSNGSPLRNLVNYGDGYLAIVKMAAQDTTPWFTRGGYFSCSSDWGESWSDCSSRIESGRRGGNNIDQIRDAGGVIVAISHDGINVNVSAGRCVDVWSESFTGGTGQLWPRVAIGSTYTVHIVYSADSPPTYVLYMRSEDAGTTWAVDIPICTTPGISIDADGYDITARGSDVAVVCAGGGGDVVLSRSTDYGISWTETIIYDVDETLLTPGELVPDGSCAVILDGDYDPHVVWGTFLSSGDGATLLYSLDAGIMYWNEETGVDTIAMSLQDTTICEPIGRDGDYISGPDIGLDSLGGVYVIYSQVLAERDPSGNCYEHIYAVASHDDGLTWSDETDITPGTGFDASFPSLADLADQNLHLVYNCDPFAGNTVQGNHDQVQVAIMYLQVPTSTFVGVDEESDRAPSVFTLEQNYPNPFNPETVISFVVPVGTRLSVSLRIYDILGQEIETLVDEEKIPGTYSVQWDASRYSSGVFFYRLQGISGDGSQRILETKKLVLLR